VKFKLKTKTKPIFLVFLIFFVSVNTFVIFEHKSIEPTEIKFSSEFPEVQGVSIKELDTLDFKDFSEEILIFGYALNAKANNPIERDENATLSITRSKFDFVDVSLKLAFGVFNYNDIPIYGNIYMDRNGEHDFVYHIEDPHRGFFMELIISSKLTFIDLAFDGGNVQLCYNGLLKKGHSTINPYFTQKIKIIHLILEIRPIKEINPQSFSRFIQETKKHQKKDLIIHQNKQGEVETLDTMIFTYYGIAHEIADFSTVNLAEDLPDDYWEPFSEIDIGIYRRSPSESKIKSDLQYYNTKYYDFPFGDYRYISAYAVYAHGGPDLNSAWYIRRYWKWDFWPFWGHYVYEYLYPDEVEDLWYLYIPYPMAQTDVHPIDTILHATICYGYSGDDGIPHMAKAFVDYGATAFIGGTISIPGLHNDEFTGDFWESLCQDDETVFTSTINYINTHNQYHDYGYTAEGENLDITWVYNNHIRIYGSTNGRLNN
jgi:hypothetical protein